MKHSIYAGDTTRKEFERRALKMPMHEPRKDQKWLEAAIWGGMMAAFGIMIYTVLAIMAP